MGKTVWAVNKVIRDVLQCDKPNARGHYFCPVQKQAKRAAWNYLIQYSEFIPGMRYNKTDLTAYFPAGQTIELLGADNPDSFRGAYSDSVVLDESAQMPADLWGEVIRPALADRQGKAVFLGTPKGPNEFKRLYDRAKTLPDWYACKLTYKDTNQLPEHEIESMRAEMDTEKFAQEMECDFNAAVKGAYYGRVLVEREQAKAARDADIYDDTLPVWTAWDLGMRDSTAIWFAQCLGNEIRLIDYLEVQGQSLPEIIKQVKAKPYIYDGHIGPHDLRVRELGTGVSRYEVAANLGINFHICRNIPVMDGIEATRNMLKRSYINTDKCAQGWNALLLYRSEYNSQRGVFSDRPIHDWTSHSADALRYLAVHLGAYGTENYGQGINYDLLDAMAV